MKYNIEKGIDLPTERTTHKYPFREMEVGDSFVFDVYSRENLRNISNAARSWSNKGSYGYKFACRKTKDGMVRIWRIL